MVGVHLGRWKRAPPVGESNASHVSERPLARQRAARTKRLALVPQENRERDAKDDGEAGQQRHPAAQAQRVEHVLREERECEAEEGAEELEGEISVSSCV